MRARRKVIPLQGGLGNQLFEVAAGLCLREATGTEVTWSTFWLDHPAPGETRRSLAVEGILRPGELISTRTPRSGLLGNRFQGWRAVETGPGEDVLGRVRPWTAHVAGYFQRLAYVDLAWPSLIDRLVASRDVDHRAFANPAPGAHGVVHMRLGDYVTNPSARAAHGVTSVEYFARAIEALNKSTGVHEWWILSDDLPQAVGRLSEARIPSDVSLVPKKTEGDWAALAVMATARACVISNSSFSWWGAFAGSRSHGAGVVAPEPWFSSRTQPEPPIFPAGWTRMSRPIERDGTP